MAPLLWFLKELRKGEYLREGRQVSQSDVRDTLKMDVEFLHEMDLLLSVLENPPIQEEMYRATILQTQRQHGLYERFLMLPVPIFLMSLWLIGATLIGVCAITLYYLLMLLWGG